MLPMRRLWFPWKWKISHVRIWKEKGAGGDRPWGSLAFDALLSPLLGTKSVSVSATVLTHSQGSGFPKKVTGEARVGGYLLSVVHPPTLGAGSSKQLQNGFLPLQTEKGHFRRARWEGCSIVWCFDFSIPRSQRYPGPFNSLKRPRWNSSKLASGSPSLFPGEHFGIWNFQGPPVWRLPALTRVSRAFPGDADPWLPALRPFAFS